MIEKSMIIIKPDALRGGVEFEVLERFRRKGFNITDMYKASPSEQLLRQHYAEVIADKGEDIAKRIIKYMTSGPVVVAILEGNNALQAVRTMSGDKTEPAKCPPGTIRHDYSSDSYDLADAQERGVANMIHSSDSAESAEREIALWFGQRDGLYGEISSAIGYNFPDLIEDIVKTANEKKMLFHGIKRPHYAEKIRRQGVKPLTPEGGPLSFWSTGLEMFHPMIDSAFFRWSGEFDPERPDICERNLAVTEYAVLEEFIEKLPQFKEDGYCTIPETVPYDAIALINVKIEHLPTEDHYQARRIGQEAEKLLLKGVMGQVYGKLAAGTTIEFHLETQGQ